ncbi:MAG: anthranilate phosphoribosyltransferase [Elusimicrobiota bacterium]
MSLGSFLETVRRGGALGRAGAREAMDVLISGEASEEDIESFLLALNERPCGPEELAGFAEGMRAKAVTVRVERSPLVDTCGTGGDGLHTFNFSTAAALVTAGAGVAVAKHGNRAVSSRSGSADVLEALGVAVDAGPDEVRRSIEEAGFGFFFAPRYHPAMRHVAPVRKRLGVRTVFNLLGPLANPALVTRQVVGIYDAGLLETYARVLSHLGARRAMVVRGEDGMDEMSLTGRTFVCHVEAGKDVRTEELTPEDVGLARTDLEALKGGDAAANARALEGVLEGRGGPLLDGTLFNAGAAIVAAGRAGSVKEGVRVARESVASGRARGVLERLRKLRAASSGESAAG